MKKIILILFFLIFLIAFTGCVSVPRSHIPLGMQHLSIPVPENASTVNVRHNGITGKLETITIDFNKDWSAATPVIEKKTSPVDWLPFIGPVCNTIENIFTGAFNYFGAKTKNRILIKQKMLPDNISDIIESTPKIDALKPQEMPQMPVLERFTDE